MFFLQNKTWPCSIVFSPDESHFVTVGRDRRIRVFHFASGKLYRVYDESIAVQTEMHESGRTTHKLDNVEFARRLSIERDLDRSDAFAFSNAVFDDSGHFLLYATLVGIKILNLRTNHVVRLLGREESTQRFLHLALFQGSGRRKKAVSLEVAGSDNPTVKEQAGETDPMLLCTA